MKYLLVAATVLFTLYTAQAQSSGQLCFACQYLLNHAISAMGSGSYTQAQLTTQLTNECNAAPNVIPGLKQKCLHLVNNRITEIYNDLSVLHDNGMAACTQMQCCGSNASPTHCCNPRPGQQC